MTNRGIRTRRRAGGAAARLLLAAAAVVAAGGGLDAPAAAAGAPAASKQVLWPNADAKYVLLAAGRTHVVAVRAAGTGSELVELKAGSEPRVITTFRGTVAQPAVGTDAAHHTVVVVSGCLQGEKTGRLPACPLSMVRLDTGAISPMPHSTGAYAGDVDAGRTVVVRDSARGARILLEPAGGGRARAVSIDGVSKRATGALENPGSRIVESIDLYRGRLAAIVHFDMEIGGGSFVLQQAGGRAPQLLARSGYGEASGIPRVWRGVQVRSSGVRAYYDGADNDRPLVARWSHAGKLVRSIGTAAAKVPVVDSSSAFDGDRLVVVAPYGYRCYKDPPDVELADCAIQSFGPFRLG